MAKVQCLGMICRHRVHNYLVCILVTPFKSLFFFFHHRWVDYFSRENGPDLKARGHLYLTCKFQFRFLSSSEKRIFRQITYTYFFLCAVRYITALSPCQSILEISFGLVINVEGIGNEQNFVTNKYSGRILNFPFNWHSFVNFTCQPAFRPLLGWELKPGENSIKQQCSGNLLFGPVHKWRHPFFEKFDPALPLVTHFTK